MIVAAGHIQNEERFDVERTSDTLERIDGVNKKNKAGLLSVGILHSIYKVGASSSYFQFDV